MLELWRLLLSAQADPSGIPQELIREKLDEKQRKLEQIQQAQKRLDMIKSFTGATPAVVAQEERKKPDRWGERPEASGKSERHMDRRERIEREERRHASERRRSRSKERRRRRSRSESSEERRRRKRKEKRRHRHSPSSSKSSESPRRRK